MKKKGFTLVELLAVIAILAILVIMALPAVLKMFNKARIDSFTNELNTVIKATRQQYLLDGGKTQTYTNANGSTNKLNITGNGELKYLIKVDGSGNVTRFQATSGDYCYNKSGTIDVVNSEDIKSNECTLNIDDNYVSLTDAVFIPGDEFTVKIKQIAGDDTSENGAGTLNTNITAIIKSNNEPIESNKTEEHIVSTSDSRYPIYAWYDNGTIYWWSEINNPSLNENSMYMFMNLKNLTNISGLNDLNVSNVTSMYGTFYNDVNLTSLSDLSNWDTSLVNNMEFMFQNCLALTSLSGLENWNVSNVTSMYGMFESDQNLTSISSLSNWNTSSITDMSYLFCNNKKLMDLTPLSNWNTSRVTNMKGMFHNNVNLEDASAISNWDVSNVEDLSYFLNVSADAGDKKYSSLPVLNISSWNMSKVKNYNYFIESLEYVQTEFTIRNSNVESYNKMLTDCANKGGQVIINYTAETENIVDQMLTTVSSGGNVIKGSLVQ